MTSGATGVVFPFLFLVGGAFTLYLVARLITSRNEWLALLTALAFAGALVSLLLLRRAPGEAVPAWGDFAPGGVALRADAGAIFVGSLALGMGACVAVYSGRYLALDRRYKTYYPLLLMMVAGLLGMVMTTDLFSLYLFCELMSVAGYVLVAFRRRTDTSIEAGFKYLIMGSVGTITLLMGVALIYRETGVLTLPQPLAAPGVWARAGLACIWVGLGLKSALAPLHTWLPDAYGRAPSSVSALFSGMIAPVYVLLKVSLALGFPARDLGLGVLLCGALNMLVGNGMALVQTHTKRLLAYSSIAQMGYALFSIGVGLRYALPAAIQAGFFMLLAHAAMKGLAFLSKGVCHFYDHTTLVSELRGVFYRLPVVAVTFSIAILGLIGVPPLAGFAGKWFILTQVWQARDGWVYAGVALFLLMVLLSLGYYLPILALLFAPPAAPAPAPVKVSGWMIAPLLVLAALVVWLGVAPGLWLRWAGEAAAALGVG